jgi:uncharacterized protein (TIGR02284 family)
MNNNEKLTETLNDLIKINNDRVAGYEKAADETNTADIDLRAIFLKMANESREYVKELSDKITHLGGTVSTDTTLSGKVYRVWMDVKNTFTGSDRQSVLESCEFGEDAAQKAYNDALHTDAEIDAETRQLIMDQKDSLKTSHDVIKKFRDVRESVK